MTTKPNVYEKHLNLLGLRATDKITGFSGVIDSVGFDLYGCIQVALKPPMDKDGKLDSGIWVDVTRLEVSGDRVMPVPNFYEGYVAEGKKGASDKPERRA